MWYVNGVFVTVIFAAVIVAIVVLAQYLMRKEKKWLGSFWLSYQMVVLNFRLMIVGIT